MKRPEWTPRIATPALVLVVFFWGASFPVVKVAVSRVDTFSFLAARFFFAALFLAVAFPSRLRGSNRRTVLCGILIGVELAVGFILQTVGMRFTSASNSAFITGMCVVIVPLIVAILDRKAPTAGQIGAVVLAALGLVLLTLKLPFRINMGDFWTLLCAFAFAVHIILISRAARGVDSLAFSVIQTFSVSVVCAGISVATTGGIRIPSDAAMWKAILFLAIFATGYTCTAQAVFQKYVSEVKAVVIYSLEPLFAVVFAYFLISEQLSLRSLAGGVCIIAAMLIADLKPRKSEADAPTSGAIASIHK